MQTDSWKDEQIYGEFGDCENLGELIETLEDYYSRQGQLVCEIRVNEMLLEGDDERRFGGTSLREIRSLTVSVGSLTELVKDVHDAFLECIPSLQETALRASDFFRDGNFDKAQNVFAALLEGCQWLVDTLVHTRRASVRYSSGIFTEGRWQDAEKEFSRNIRQILVAFEKRDYALLADILEYEITATLESWLLLLGESTSVYNGLKAGAVSGHSEQEHGHFDGEALKENADSERLQDPMGGQ